MCELEPAGTGIGEPAADGDADWSSSDGGVVGDVISTLPTWIAEYMQIQLTKFQHTFTGSCAIHHITFITITIADHIVRIVDTNIVDTNTAGVNTGTFSITYIALWEK